MEKQCTITALFKQSALQQVSAPNVDETPITCTSRQLVSSAVDNDRPIFDVIRSSESQAESQRVGDALPSKPTQACTEDADKPTSELFTLSSSPHKPRDFNFPQRHL